jgi:uncharacterized Zn-binding protein involved in type VI secretion
VIRIGDPTSHGGKVVSASGNFSMFDKQVARVGDVCTCPRRGHSNCKIVEGDPTWTIDGKNVALEGHKTSCGATLISTLGSVTRSYEGSGSVGSAVSGAEVLSKDSPANYSHDLHFLLSDSLTGVPLVRQPYRLEVAGKVINGETNDEGYTELISTGHGSKQVKWSILGEIDHGK